MAKYPLNQMLFVNSGEKQDAQLVAIKIWVRSSSSLQNIGGLYYTTLKTEDWTAAAEQEKRNWNHQGRLYRSTLMLDPQSIPISLDRNCNSSESIAAERRTCLILSCHWIEGRPSTTINLHSADAIGGSSSSRTRALASARPPQPRPALRPMIDLNSWLF